MTGDLYQLGRKRWRRILFRPAVVFGFLASIAFGAWLATQRLLLHIEPPSRLPHVPYPAQHLEAIAVALGLLVLITLYLRWSLLAWLGALLATASNTLAQTGRITTPLDLHRWWPALSQQDHLADLALTWLAAGSVATFLFLLWAAYDTLWRGTHSDAHGSARFAAENEINPKQIAIGHGSGIVIGGLAPRYRWRPIRPLIWCAEGHVLLFAPPDAGKTTGVVVPTLFQSTEHSRIVLDPKGELYRLTAGHAARAGHRVHRWDPRGFPGVTRINPLETMPRDSNDVAAAQRIATGLVYSSGVENPDYWKDTAAQLLTALILHVFYSRPDAAHLGTVRTIVASTQRFEHLLAEMILTKHDPSLSRAWEDDDGRPSATHPEVRMTAYTLLQTPDRQLQGVVGTASTALKDLADPQLAGSIAALDFDPIDLLEGDKPVTLYLTIPEEAIERVAGIVRIILRELCKAFTSHDETKNRRRILFIGEEFPQFGRMDFFERFIAICRGKGVTCLIVVQSIVQLYKLYTRDHAFVSNSSALISYGATDVETLKVLSDLIGQRTVDADTVSLDTGGNRMNVSQTVHGRALAGADELRRLPRDQMIALPSYERPIHGRKPFFFENAAWLRATKIEPPRDFAAAELPAVPLRSGLTLPSRDQILAFLENYWEQYERSSNDGPRAGALDP